MKRMCMGCPKQLLTEIRGVFPKCDLFDKKKNNCSCMELFKLYLMIVLILHVD